MPASVSFGEAEAVGGTGTGSSGGDGEAGSADEDAKGMRGSVIDKAIATAGDGMNPLIPMDGSLAVT